jgi:hypothetical protein
MDTPVMWKDLTRSKLIQAWSAAVVLIVVAAVAFNLSIGVSTAVMLFALSLIPPVIVLMLWPGDQPRTAADVLYGDRRP